MTEERPNTSEHKKLKKKLGPIMKKLEESASNSLKPQIYLPPSVLYHYTGASGLEGIIKNNCIRATDIRFMNDASEITYASNLFKQLIRDRKKATNNKHLGEFLGRVENTFDVRELANIYSVSFSESCDDVTQWRAYSGTRGGYAIGLDLRQLSLPNSFFTAAQAMLVKVLYDKQDQESLFNGVMDVYVQSLQNIQNIEESMMSNAIATYCQSIRLSLSDLIFRIKNQVFEQEHEWRVLAIFPISDQEAVPVKYRPGSLGMIPYIDFALHASAGVFNGRLPIQEVVQGPRSEPELCKGALDGFLKSHGYSWPITEVRVSDVPLRF